MKTIFTVLAVASALTSPAFADYGAVPAHVEPETVTLPEAHVWPTRDILTEGIQFVEVEAPAQVALITATSDPFNPLPFSTPISRSRLDVFVTDEWTTCPRIWAALDCPVVVRADGTREGMVIGNYTHTTAGPVTVERIEYPQSVTFTDAWPLYFVAVGE